MFFIIATYKLVLIKFDTWSNKLILNTIHIYIVLKLKRLKLLNQISAKFLPNFSIEKGLTACTLVLIYNFVFCEITIYVFYALFWKMNKDAVSKGLVILTNIRFFCRDQQNYHENLRKVTNFYP